MWRFVSINNVQNGALSRTEIDYNVIKGLNISVVVNECFTTEE